MEELINSIVSQAKQFLLDFGEFFTFGFAISKEGKISSIGVHFGDEHPASQEVIMHLEKGFKSGLLNGSYSVVAMCVDVLATPPGSNEKTEALEIRIDGIDIEPINYYFPYSKQANGEIAIQGKYSTSGTAIRVQPISASIISR